MKKKITIIAVIWLSIISLALLAPPEKKISLTRTQSQWVSILMTLQNADEVMRKSSYQGVVISQCQDSLRAFAKDINDMLTASMKDTTMPVKK